MSGTQLEVLKQHLIDPEVCIRCNTCEETCPVNAITHDSANYVVNADLCNFCMACISPCPTGSIDNWRTVLRSEPYSVEEQLTWGELPAQGTIAVPATSESDQASATPPKAGPPSATQIAPTDDTAGEGYATGGIEVDVVRGSTMPPWSAARPYVNLYTHKAPITATCAGNLRLTADGIDNDVRHIVLDFGQTPFPVLEGQSIAVLPPGETAVGRAHHARQYSIASARDGERRGYNNLSLTVKRVTAGDKGDTDGGICSNYLCDLKKGDQVQVIGPFGATFLMPNHPSSHLLMICTGTGSAPMRAMTEYRRRRRLKGATGKLMLFFGARTKEELPYFGPLMSLPKDFIDVNLAFSRTPGQPKTYVQDAMRKRAPDIAAMLKDDNTYIYVCGLKDMEDGVIQALGEIAGDSGQPWEPLWQKLKSMGRLHFETY